MPTPANASRKPPGDIEKTAARRFPLVHRLIHFADLRNFYREMREALITANRRAGAQQGLVTKAKKKIATLEEDIALLEQERVDLLAYRQRAEAEAAQIARLLPRLKARLLQVQQIEQALENLADIKEAVDQQDRANGGPSRQSIDDLKRAIERLLERADAVEFFEEAIEAIEADATQPESANDDDQA
jgi:chromosome segregation ATPase